DERTQWFRMHCPEKGAILGYKKCVNDRLVQLLIPTDAKRTSATLPSCRCSKAKVLTIKSFDSSLEFDEAWSLVDENFVYRRGDWAEVKDFNEDRWMDSTTGIHFWMTREEAIAY
ncbi:MAG: pentapeptide repeat-containing protein, partial [Lachnospiraceae bacterium]|nr:pentapeptide repeat-containing protein [Lachnospiraceae bacterium]